MNADDSRLAAKLVGLQRFVEKVNGMEMHVDPAEGRDRPVRAFLCTICHASFDDIADARRHSTREHGHYKLLSKEQAKSRQRWEQSRSRR